MATSLITRETAGAGATVKNAPLTNEEVDLNFISITDNKLEADNNLSDLSNASTARSNLGLEIGVDVQEFDANTAKLDATTSNFTGTLQEGGNDVAVYADTIANFTGDLQVSGSSVLVDSDIGSTVQAFDANNATFDAVNPTFTDTGALGVPTGTQAERPGTPASGQIRFNADVNEFEGYNGTEWDSIGGGSEIQNDTSSTTDFYPTLADATTGDLEVAYVSDTKLFYQPSTGTLNATEFNSLSDVSVKTNVNEITSGLDVVNAIAGVEFDWKDNGNHSAGVIAQELEKVLPHLVSTSEEGMKSVNYAGLTAYLLSAVKELSSKVGKI
jgi:hypothetical protein